MSESDWGNEAWEQIPDYERYWAPFDAKFHFHAGMDPSRWPAIDEPPGSVTIDLAPIFARDGRDFAADEEQVNELTLQAFLEVFDPETRLVALDWQHPAYWFWPHRHASSAELWRVPPFPNGDYFIVITEDLSQGTFGHPWEQSLCIWGKNLVPELTRRFRNWLPVKRSKPA